MLGRVRASPMSSLESLEMERSSPKIIKHDSLSIYETTILKLKRGSQLSLNATIEDTDTMDDVCGTSASSSSEEEAMNSDADCSSTDSSQKSGSFQPTGSSKEQRSKNSSIVDLFSKYTKNSRYGQSSSDKELIVGSGSSSCSIVSFTSSS